MIQMNRASSNLAETAARLGVSLDAVELLAEADFIDLHCDLEVPVRVLGYDPARHHGRPWWQRPFFGHTDYPRLREAGMTGVVYDIATNPFRSASRRQAVTLRNMQQAAKRIAVHPDDLELVHDHAGYERARAAGRTALWMSLQGGNALSHDLSVLDGEVGQQLHRITLVHLTTSDLGGTNSPWGHDDGLTDLGARFVEACNANRVLVDLAHAGKRTFWDTLDVHARDLPPIVSHTGIAACHQHWRNVDDDQIRAIADRGGVVGVIYHSHFLDRVLTTCQRSRILDHLEHVCELVGDDVAAIGTDYDGFILPPHDLPDVTDHPLLVQDMLDRGWSESRITKVLGLNYLRVAEHVRPG